MAIEKPNRNKTLIARCTETEGDRARELAQLSDLVLSEYIRRRVLGQVIRPPRPVVERELLLELTRIGTNLNQLTRAVNAGNYPATGGLPTTLQKLKNQLERIADQVQRLSPK